MEVVGRRGAVNDLHVDLLCNSSQVATSEPLALIYVWYSVWVLVCHLQETLYARTTVLRALQCNKEGLPEAAEALQTMGSLRSTVQYMACSNSKQLQQLRPQAECRDCLCGVSGSASCATKLGPATSLGFTHIM